VDFHSFRRQFKQSLADAGVDLQLSMTLSGATNASARRRYLNNTPKVRTMPPETLASFGIGLAGSRLPVANSTGEISLISGCRRADLNRRQRAYEVRSEQPSSVNRASLRIGVTARIRHFPW
jgi:hypothetical protein